jgi:hypothetical protein
MSKKQIKDANETTTLPAVVQATAAGLGIFNADPELEAELSQNFEQKSLPLISPKEMPVGACFVARIMGVQNSMVETIKSRVLELEARNGSKFLFPMPAVLGAALGEAVRKRDRVGNGAEEYIGHEVFVKYVGDKPPKDKDGRPTRIFDVRVSKDAKE